MKWIGLGEALTDAGRVWAAPTLGNQTNLAVENSILPTERGNVMRHSSHEDQAASILAGSVQASRTCGKNLFPCASFGVWVCDTKTHRSGRSSECWFRLGRQAAPLFVEAPKHTIGMIHTLLIVHQWKGSIYRKGSSPNANRVRREDFNK